MTAPKISGGSVVEGARSCPRVLLSYPKPETRSTFAIGERSRFFISCFLLAAPQMCLNQTPGRRPPRITSRFVCTVAAVQISWRSRWFCRLMSVEDSESRRVESTFGWVFLREILAQHLPNNYFSFCRNKFGLELV